MSEIEAKSGGQQTPFRTTGRAEDDAVSAVYEKRRAQIYHRQYHQLFLRFRKAADHSRNVPRSGDWYRHLFRISAF